LRRRADDLVTPDPIRDIAPIAVNVLAQPELFPRIANLSFYFFRFWCGEEPWISRRKRMERVVLFVIGGRQSMLVSPGVRDASGGVYGRCWASMTDSLSIALGVYQAAGPGMVRVWTKVYSPISRSSPEPSVASKRAIITSDGAALA
jgi:hypothetical protein